MKLITLITTTALLGSLPAFAGGNHDHAHAHDPMHGGVVVEVKDIDLELVAQADRIQLYLRDHGKPVDVSKGHARLTLLTGSDKQDIELTPAGDKLQATGTFKLDSGSKAVAVVTLPGKAPTTARFVLK